MTFVLPACLQSGNGKKKGKKTKAKKTPRKKRAVKKAKRKPAPKKKTAKKKVTREAARKEDLEAWPWRKPQEERVHEDMPRRVRKCSWCKKKLSTEDPNICLKCSPKSKRCKERHPKHKHRCEEPAGHPWTHAYIDRGSGNRRWWAPWGIEK